MGDGTRIGRRTVLRAGAGIAGLVAAGSVAGPVLAKPGGGGGGGGGKGGGGGGNGGGGPTTTTGNLFIPPIMTAGVLAARRVTQTSHAFQPSSFLGYGTSQVSAGGTMPGPTFVIGRGGGIDVTFHNQLDGHSTVHWHGMVVPTGVDGQPQESVAAGGERPYRFTVDQRATMNWYHPHPHGHTAEQVALGLAGAVIIRDAEEAALGLPSGGYEVPLILRDADLDRQGALIYKPRSSGYLGKLPLVNGTRDAVMDVRPAVYRFRILNGSNGRVMQVSLSNGAAFTLIGVEGGLLPRAYGLSSIDLGMAERLDVLVDFSGLGGQTVSLRDTLSGWDLVTFQVVDDLTVNGTTMEPAAVVALRGRGVLSSTAAPFWTPGTPLPSAQPDQTFSFDGMGRINGRSFEMERVDAWIQQGATEVWRFTTGGNGPHPVHVHGEYFQVLAGSGGRRDGVTGPDGRVGVFPWEDGLKDTVLLQDGETVDVAVRFSAHPGFYLMHCHKLEHEDAGMMINFNVHQGTRQQRRPLGLASYNES